MKKVVVLVVVLLILPTVFAQLPWSVTDLRCGDGVLDEFELCEKDVEESRCDALAGELNIAMACYDQHCTCVPRINPTYCGNNRRDFNEMCDGTAEEDICPALGEIMGNLSLTCNKQTCGCDIATVSDSYDPKYLEELSNASETPSSCGDKKVERNEECDPPNTLCTTNTNDPGVCSDKCKCVPPEMLGVEEPEVKEEPTVETNETVEENTTESAIKEIVEIEPEEVEKEDDEPGFFGRIWGWFKGLFG